MRLQSLYIVASSFLIFGFMPLPADENEVLNQFSEPVMDFEDAEEYADRQFYKNNVFNLDEYPLDGYEPKAFTYELETTQTDKEI